MDVAGKEQSNYETETNIGVGADIASPAEMSSGEQLSTSNNSSKPTINIRKNIPQDIAKKRM